MWGHITRLSGTLGVHMHNNHMHTLLPMSHSSSQEWIWYLHAAYRCAISRLRVQWSLPSWALRAARVCQPCGA